MNDSISSYFEKYQSDKAVNGYSGIYDEIFASRRNDDIKLLEIGIGTLHNTESNMLFWKREHLDYYPGASLKAFRDYFINGRIYGIDIQLDCAIIEENIFSFIFNSTDKSLCDFFLSGLSFDFIIDDGDHHSDSQIKTFENLFPKLNPGGVYVIEDLAFPQDIKNYFATKDYNCDFRNPPYGLVLIKK